MRAKGWNCPQKRRAKALGQNLVRYGNWTFARSKGLGCETPGLRSHYINASDSELGHRIVIMSHRVPRLADGVGCASCCRRYIRAANELGYGVFSFHFATITNVFNMVRMKPLIKLAFANFKQHGPYGMKSPRGSRNKEKIQILWANVLVLVLLMELAHHISTFWVH